MTGYKILWNSGSGEVYTDTHTVTDPTVFSWTTTATLQVGYGYKFKIRAYNLYGDGVLSAATAEIISAAEPSQPTGLTLISSSSTSISFSWTAPFDGGSAITGYKLVWD